MRFKALIGENGNFHAVSWFLILAFIATIMRLRAILRYLKVVTYGAFAISLDFAGFSTKFCPSLPLRQLPFFEASQGQAEEKPFNYEENQFFYMAKRRKQIRIKPRSSKMEMSSIKIKAFFLGDFCYDVRRIDAMASTKLAKLKPFLRERKIGLPELRQAYNLGNALCNQINLDMSNLPRTIVISRGEEARILRIIKPLAKTLREAKEKGLIKGDLESQTREQ